MGMLHYKIGRNHGLLGIRHMAHRKLRRYDSHAAQTSYDVGYKSGYKERMESGKQLDYTQPLNNQLFMEDQNMAQAQRD